MFFLSRMTQIWFPSHWISFNDNYCRIVLLKLLTHPEHLSSPPVFSGIRVTRSLVLGVCFVDLCIIFCPSSFGHCVICPSSFGHCVICPSVFWPLCCLSFLFWPLCYLSFFFWPLCYLSFFFWPLCYLSFFFWPLCYLSFFFWPLCCLSFDVRILILITT